MQGPRWASTFVLFFVTLAIFSSAKRSPPVAFQQPHSEAVDNVNPLIGNGGADPNSSGGMIPSVAPPFGMTRWVAQTRQNYVSMTPYNYTDTHIHGFQGTHQPAIWMGESGPVIVTPGVGYVKDLFEERGLSFDHDSEVITPSYYSVELDGQNIKAEMTATSRVAQLRFSFSSEEHPYVLVSATRPTILTSDDLTKARVSYPNGTIQLFPETNEVCGSNEERQDWIIAPVSTPALNWKGYFCARFDQPFASYGIAQNGSLTDNAHNGEGSILSAYVKFPSAKSVVVRVGVSFISIEQARKNINNEIPDGVSIEQTARKTRAAWAEKLDRIRVEGASDDDKEVFYTAAFHALQYPYEQHEDGKYYSGYDDAVHEGESYTGYSIWDTYRAAWAWLILMAPERVSGMITSMLQDYQEGGWLPMWKNIIETNIMIATHSDALIAEAVVKGVTGFDKNLAWEAVFKDATVPPVNDHNTSYFDRQEGVDYEVRAGLSTTYAQKGWVAADVHSEAASRTLGYAYNDYAVSVLSEQLGLPSNVTEFFRQRAFEAPFTIFNNETGFMEARNMDGSWAGETVGWTEGDKWAYTFDVVHDIPGLAQRRGGNATFVQSLEDHFEGGHNFHTNEPSHHIPYLYALAGRPDRTQARVRQIAKENYFAAVDGLSGNEDCGQMSAWYLFSAMGFYPVDPVSGEYVIGSPFFDTITLDLPGARRPLVITSQGAPSAPYIKALMVNGDKLDRPIIRHEQFQDGGEIVFEMGNEPTAWGSNDPSQTALEHNEL